MPISAPENSGRIQGRFLQGLSGNPAGRPRGSRNRTTLAAQALLDGEAEALTRKAVDLALDGDIAALRLCLERIIPVRREPIDLSLHKTEVRIDVRQISPTELAALEIMLGRMIGTRDAVGTAEPQGQLG